MAEPTNVQCASACTVTVVHELSLPPLQLTAEEAGPIAVSILLVWAAGFAIREIIGVVRHSDKVETE